MAKYLIARLSAMGDVAMLLPVVYAVARANPQHRFTMLTQPFLTTLMLSPPANLEAMAIDTKREERSVRGLLSYAERLRREHFDYFIDLHNVLRTKLLRLVVHCSTPTKCIALKKPRKARRRLLSQRPRDLAPLPSMLELYVQTLRTAGLTVPEVILPISLEVLSPLYHTVVKPYLSQGHGRIRLGVAPMASTEAKTYDLAMMEQVVERLMQSGRYQVYLLGSHAEAKVLELWGARYGAISLAGQLGLQDELYAIAALDAMLSMDSANAHLAAMVGTPVISIWCSTHPSAGFLALGQRLQDCLQPQELPCRPCSIFGKVDVCELGDMPCRRAVPVDEVLEALNKRFGLV